MNDYGMFAKAVKCLMKDPTQRKHDELAILQSVVSPLSFFKKLMKKNLQKQLALCLRLMSCQKFYKGQTVFYKGDRPKYFYIILQGEVLIIDHKESDALHREIENPTPEQLKFKASINRLMEIKHLVRDFEDLAYEQRLAALYGLEAFHEYSYTKYLRGYAGTGDRDNMQSSQVPKNKYGRRHTLLVQQMKLPKTREYDVPIQELDNKVLLSDLDEPDRYYREGVFRYLLLNRLSQGMAFGEGGLILHQGRAATVICSSDCVLATLGKDEYKMVLLEMQQDKMINKSLFICESISNRVTPDAISHWVTYFQKTKIQINNILIKEGEESKYIYIIKKGEILCSKKEIIGGVPKSANPLQKEILPVQLRPLALLREGSLFGFTTPVFTASVASSFVVVYAASKLQIQQMFDERPFIREAFEIQNRELDEQLMSRPRLNIQSIKSSPEPKGHIRTDAAEIESTNEIDYGRTITKTCQSREQMSKAIILPFKQQSGDEVLRQFDQIAVDRLEKKQKRRQMFIRKLVEKNPHISPPERSAKTLTTEQKIRLQRTPRIINQKIDHNNPKQDLAQLLRRCTLNTVETTVEQQPLTMNNIQKFLDSTGKSPKCLSIKSSVVGSSQSKQRPSTRMSATTLGGKHIHLRAQSQHNLFRTKTRVEVELLILSKRFSDLKK